MAQNNHIQALTRLLALHVAHGNMTEAEKLLDWAYNNPNTDDLVCLCHDCHTKTHDKKQ